MAAKSMGPGMEVYGCVRHGRKTVAMRPATRLHPRHGLSLCDPVASGEQGECHGANRTAGEEVTRQPAIQSRIYAAQWVEPAT